MSGYLIGSQKANQAPLPPKAELQWWDQYYFRTARSFDNPDHVDIVIHHTRSPLPTPRSSPASTPTGSSRVVSGTTCPRKAVVEVDGY